MQKRNHFPPSSAVRDAFERAFTSTPGATKLHRMVHRALYFRPLSPEQRRRDFRWVR